MTSKWLLSLLGMISFGAATWSHAQTSSVGTEKAVTELENKWLESQKTNNADLMALLLSDTYVSTRSHGQLRDKAQTLADAKSDRWTSLENEDVKVRAYGDAAIVTGAFKGKGTHSGTLFADYLRFTDTWVKMPDGKWQLVATHYSLAQVKK